MPDKTPSQSYLKPNRRRSQRVMLHLPITVRTQDAPPDNSFDEETQTLIVNAHGALIALEGKVEIGQTLLITSRATKAEQLCQVVYLGNATGGKTQIGIEFLKPSPDFWQIVFPQEDAVALKQAPEDTPIPRKDK